MLWSFLIEKHWCNTIHNDIKVGVSDHIIESDPLENVRSKAFEMARGVASSRHHTVTTLLLCQLRLILIVLQIFSWFDMETKVWTLKFFKWENMIPNKSSYPDPILAFNVTNSTFHAVRIPGRWNKCTILITIHTQHSWQFMNSIQHFLSAFNASIPVQQTWQPSSTETQSLMKNKGSSQKWGSPLNCKRQN